MIGPDVPGPCEVCFLLPARDGASTCSDACEAELRRLINEYEGASLPAPRNPEDGENGVKW